MTYNYIEATRFARAVGKFKKKQKDLASKIADIVIEVLSDPFNTSEPLQPSNQYGERVFVRRVAFELNKTKYRVFIAVYECGLEQEASGRTCLHHPHDSCRLQNNDCRGSVLFWGAMTRSEAHFFYKKWQDYFEAASF
jgi:Txe/YoeB family toxin of Txe-Axe toxin-antitoxin module